MHDSAVVVLMEARTSGLRADEIVARTQFSRVSKVEAQGLMGDLAFLEYYLIY